MEPQRTRLNRLSPELFKDRATDSINLEVNWGGKRVAILESSLLDANGNRISRNLLEQLVVLYSRHENPEKLERLFKIEENQGVLFAKLMNYRPVYSVSEPISTEGVVIPSNLQPMSDKPMEWIEVDPIERRYGTSNPDWKPLDYIHKPKPYEIKSFPRIHMDIYEYTPEEIKERIEQNVQKNQSKKRRYDTRSELPLEKWQRYREGMSFVPKETMRVTQHFHLDSTVQKKPATERDITHYRAFMKVAWSFEHYMNEALFNPKTGYYTTRSNQIGMEKDFQTTATDSPKLAFQIASQAFLMWKTMVQSGDISADETFTLLEVGAGTGVMAYNILTFLATYGIQSANPEYLKFYKNIKYVIAEISPELRKKQTETNQVWIESGKMEVQTGDARRLTDTIKQKFKGAVISNELPDAFPVHQVRGNEKRELEALSVIATVPKSLYNQHSNLFSSFIAKSDEYKQQFKDILGSDVQNDFILAANDVLNLPKEVATQIVWKHVYVPLEVVPELNEVKKQFGYELFVGLKQPIYVNTHLTSFMNSVSEVLQEGFVLTVDYGGAQSSKSGRRTDEDFRTFGIGVTQKNPTQNEFDSFGMVDLTTDVNFTMLAKAGADVNFAPLVFTYQSELSQVMKDNSSSVLGVDGVDKNFSLLIQQKRTTKSEYFVPVVNRQLTYFDLFANRATDTTLPTRVLVKAYLDFKAMSGIGENLNNFNAFMSECYPEFEEPELIQQFIFILQNYGSIQEVASQLQIPQQKNELHIRDVLSSSPRDIRILEQAFTVINQKLPS